MEEQDLGPGARRRYLGKALRRLRENNKLRTTEVAKLVRITQPTVSRIEGGRHAIMPRHVYRMLEIYGADELTSARVMRLAEDDSEHGWWESYGDVIQDWFEIYASLESDTSEIWTYETEFVPGQFQTEDYARAIVLAANPASSPDQVDRLVQLRKERQAQRGDQKMIAVVNEAVVLRQVGGAEVMRAQLRRLLEESRNRRIELRLLPFSVGAHAAMSGPFAMLRFPDTGGADMDLVYVEHERGSVYLERPADLIRYTDVFTRSRNAALPVRKTAEYLV
ncbi:MAG: helix-turn-helix transcriptional regulator, partial [Kibdelosporangium sp.]